MQHSVETLGEKGLCIGGPKEWMGVHEGVCQAAPFGLGNRRTIRANATLKLADRSGNLGTRDLG